MQWISVKERLPDDGVLISYLTEWGKRETEQAYYVPDGEEIAGEWWGSDDWRYDCVTDDGYVKSGWYTASCAADTVYPIKGTVTHWMPIPDPPQGGDTD